MVECDGSEDEALDLGCEKEEDEDEEVDAKGAEIVV